MRVQILLEDCFLFYFSLSLKFSTYSVKSYEIACSWVSRVGLGLVVNVFSRPCASTAGRVRVANFSIHTDGRVYNVSREINT